MEEDKQHIENKIRKKKNECFGAAKCGDLESEAFIRTPSCNISELEGAL